jgi:ubiquinone/menaquinone biosynthesis C-methylase UbiE
MKVNATKTSALKNRILSQANQTLNLNEWVFSHLDGINDVNILELCCGTGAQTKFLAQLMGNGTLDCVDVNQETIEENRSKINDDRVNYHVSNIDNVKKYLPRSVDMVFSSYGFYYSSDPVVLHKELSNHLTENGRFVLVGPVLGNNDELYSIVHAIGGDISDDVMYSSERFMLEMQRVFLEFYEIVNFHRVKNKVYYDSVDDLFKYWKSTTFYDPKMKKEFISKAEEFYEANNIVVTKSIAYLEGHM